MGNPVAHFEIYGNNPTKLGQFYQELFGWKINPVPGMEYWSIETVPSEKGRPTQPGGINGGLMKWPNPEPKAESWLNYVTVSSLEETLGEARKLGAHIIKSKSPVPKMGWFAIVADPEQNVFGIWQDDPEAA